MVEGAIRLGKGEWEIPLIVAQATRECRLDSDLLSQWIGECCITGTGKTWTKELYHSYYGWCKARNEYCGSHSVFTRRMLHLDFQKHSSNGKNWLLGIQLLPPLLGPNTPEPMGL